jgi:hypothetical protein
MPDLLKTVMESVPAAAVILCVILFLKYIRSRDEKDIKIHKQCEETITGIVNKHDDRTKEFQDSVHQMDSTVRRLSEKK